MVSICAGISGKVDSLHASARLYAFSILLGLLPCSRMNRSSWTLRRRSSSGSPEGIGGIRNRFATAAIVCASSSVSSALLAARRRAVSAAPLIRGLALAADTSVRVIAFEGRTAQRLSAAIVPITSSEERSIGDAPDEQTLEKVDSTGSALKVHATCREQAHSEVKTSAMHSTEHTSGIVGCNWESSVWDSGIGVLALLLGWMSLVASDVATACC
mmetsp:Transcript_33400/g.71302  ORF Transcript_33400/g.71302 Transcript_33400/m.71302 type:complete len:215 (-) Transcript_33400:169-813(-)